MVRPQQTQKHKKHVPADIKDLKSTIQGMWKQITHGVSDPVKTKFEETLSYFDKMHAVRAKRALTAEEQGVYDRTRKVIIARFEDMFERAEPAVNARRNMKREHHIHNHNNKRTARKSMHGGGDTVWEMAMKFPIWVWDGLKAMINGILSFFGSIYNEKQKLFMEYFSPSRLLKTVGATESDPDGAIVKLDGITAKIGQSIEKLQRTVVGGVSGAATASMDMILNAFSMMPGIGTTLLVWRMFQNLLVIIGASLSVQSGQTESSNSVSDTINGAKSGESPAVVNEAAAKQEEEKKAAQTVTAGEQNKAAEGGKISKEESKLMEEERTKPIPKDAFAVFADDGGDGNPAKPIVVVKIVEAPSTGGKTYKVKPVKDAADKAPEEKERINLISQGELDVMLKITDKADSAKEAKAEIEKATKVAGSAPPAPPPPPADSKTPPPADAKAAPPPPAAGGQGGGGGKATKSTDVTTANAVRASARALNQSLKRFSGMSTRVSSLLMKESKKTKQKTPRNPLSLLTSTSAAASSSLTGYALKPLSISRFIHA